MLTAYADTGTVWLGWAIFDGASLHSCGLSRATSKTLPGRAQEHRENLEKVGWMACDRRVAEIMVYRGRNHVGSPQIQMDQNWIAGHIASAGFTTQGWKGNQDKNAHLQNVVLSALRESEKLMFRRVRPAGQAHNALSAIGMGLFDVGRINRR